MTISSDSAKRRNLDRSSLTSASATWRTRRPVVDEPVRSCGFRDDREDLDGFARDVIEHSHFPGPEAILRLAHAPQPFDPALADPGGLVPQVPLEGVPHLGAAIGRQRPEGLGRRGGQNDRVRHYSQTMAILGTAVKRHRLIAVGYGKWTTTSGGRPRPASGVTVADARTGAAVTRLRGAADDSNGGPDAAAMAHRGAPVGAG